MRGIFTLLYFLVMTSIVSGQIISQYVDTDAGTAPKGIEIWNNTGSTLDFTTNNLVIEKGTNGSIPSSDFELSSGTLASGEVLVIGSSDIEATALVNGAAFHVKAFTFNGDDALVVKYGDTTTDVFGTPEVDPGTAWEGNGVSTADQNIVLLESITSGDMDGWFDPSERFETISTNPSGEGGLSGFGLAPPGNKSKPSNHITNLSSNLGVPEISSIVFSWTDALAGSGETSPDGYLIKGSDVDFHSINNPIDGTPEDNNTLIKNVSPGEETVIFSDLNPSTTYYFKVFPFSNFGSDIVFKTDGTVPSISETTETPKLIISEVTDPTDVYQARFVEIYNLGDSPINFSEQEWYLSRQTNGSSSSWEDNQLTGAIPARGTYILANSNDNESDHFYTSFGFLANFDFGGTAGNGDDGYFLYFGGNHSTGILIDSYGVIDEAGNGTDWDYEDKKAVRRTSVIEPNSSWTFSEWEITIANVADCDPGYYRNSGGSNSQEVSVTGTVDFNSGLTAVEFAIASLTGSDDVTVSKFTNDPSNVSGISEAHVSQYRWLIEVGAGITAVDTELRLYLSAMPNHGINEGDAGIKLYKRAVEGTGAFTLVGTLAYNDNSTVGDQTDDWLSITNVTSFSEFVLASDTSPLPVQLTSFTANFNENTNFVELNWETATEVNNAGFEVHRSSIDEQFNEGDFEVLDFVKGNGTVNSPRHYEYTDSTLPDAEKLWYRLKQIDNDGEYAYSKVRSVGISNVTSVDDEELTNEFSLAQNFPNPFNPTTRIKFSLPEVNGAQVALLKVFNLLGQEVTTLVNETKPMGVYEVEFDASRLQSGVYFYSLNYGEFKQTKKLLLIK